MLDKAGIRDQFKKTLGRNDITNELADTFIDQAVSRIQRTLRVPAMEKIAEYLIDFDNEKSVTIPEDFLSMRFFFAGDRELQHLPIGRFMALSPAVGTPSYYTRIGGEFRVHPAPPQGTKLSLVYYGEIPDLAADNSTNFLCAIAPDLLVYGALCFAADYFVDDRRPVFEEAFNRIYEELVEQALLVEMEQSAMVIAPAYNTEY